MQYKRMLVLTFAALSFTGVARAQITVQMYAVSDEGRGALLGTVVISDEAHGLAFTPALTGLPPGLHGFHLHENASCEPAVEDGKPVAALAAGGHYNPGGSNMHGSPLRDGHLGDLPALNVDAEGNSNEPVQAPRLALAVVSMRALMIHAGADNYADEPAPLGGGGGRIACGIVQQSKEVA